MIKSKYFWTGTVLLACIPLLVMDLPKHYFDWHREVRDEMSYIAQNTYHYSVKQKIQILGEIKFNNKSLKAKMYIKVIAGFLLLCLGTYSLWKYGKEQKKPFGKAFAICVVLVAGSIALKLFLWTSFTGNQKIKLLSLSTADTTLGNIYNSNFKGKVVYVDFWGTTCAPCLEEFMHFTKPFKAKYQNNSAIAWLYIGGGTKLIWKQQLQKFELEGSHIFLGTNAYRELFTRSVKGSKDSVVTMPRYLIIDKHGKIVDTEAPPPSEIDAISAELDKYLAVN
jgi:thiol-disulfide isomerase/thioredoxin